ncbi:MAG: DUF3579 domain-containing protein [Betaproteobacteria bacterium]|nr:DUF3579 domain-containing protein [Betaproteobacteria bacterium]
MNPPTDFIIKGLTKAGKPFRPSDWAERLCGMMSVFGQQQKLKYSPYVRPILIEGVRSVVVGAQLAELEPRLYSFLIHFAQDNELQITYQADAIASLLPRVAAPRD